MKVGFPGGSDGKELAWNAGDLGLIPGSGRSPGEFPLQYSCLENPMDRGTWRATVQRVAKSQTWLSDYHTHTHRDENKQKSNMESSFLTGDKMEKYLETNEIHFILQSCEWKLKYTSTDTQTHTLITQLILIERRNLNPSSPADGI